MADQGHILLKPPPGRRFDQFVADARAGRAQEIVHQDLSDKEIDAPCSECGASFAPKRCDYPVAEPHKLTCDRRLCEACAVHIFTRNDCDYCQAHAKEAGIRLHAALRPYEKRVGLPNDVLYRKAAFAEELREATRLALTHIYAQERALERRHAA